MSHMSIHWWYCRSVEGMRSKMSELAKKLGLPENMQL